MLSHYKTELCKKPPRLCRQGYACPYYHNSKDRRRSPHKHKYRCFGTPSVAFILVQTHVNRVVLLCVVSTEHCPVLLWNRVRNGGIPVNVRELRLASIVTPGRSSNFILRFVCFCIDLSQTLVQIITCSFVILQIYKSTKCNDMQQCGSCPRGPFCAFAHIESKLI